MALKRRKRRRVPAVTQAVCDIKGVRHPVTLVDASEHGCCAWAYTGGAEVGDKAVLHIGPRLAIPAVVAWVDTLRLGLKFSSGKHGAMVKQFVAHLAVAELP